MAKFYLRRAMRPVLILVFAAIATGVNAQSGINTPRRPLPSPNTTVAAGRSTVKGRVVYKDNGEPLKKTRLRIFTSADSGLVAFTNDGGEFVVPNLAAGKYYVTVEGPGVAMQSGFGMRLPMPMSAIPRAEDFEEVIPRHDGSFTVNGTDNIEVEIRVARGGILSGKVMKPDGAPVSFVPVTLLSREGRTNGPYSSRYSAETGKDGKYKLENIPEGDYIVSAAIENKSSVPDIRARLRGENQVVTYHPAAINARDAVPVHVDAGRETGNVNITLVVRNTFALSGTVVRGGDGSPLTGAMVVLRSKDAESSGALVPGMGQRNTTTDSEGRWSFSNVLEGEYVVTALLPRGPRDRVPGEPPPDREELFRDSRMRYVVAHQEIVLSGSSLKDVSLAIFGPGSIVGTVQTDDGSPLPEGLVIFVELVDKGNRPGPPMPVRVRLDGSFVMSGVPSGETYLGIAMAPGAPLSIKSLSLGGDDLARSPIRIVEGAEAGPIQVLVSSAVATLKGLLLTQNDHPVSDYQILLAPAEAGKQRFRTAYLTGKTRGDGSFEITGPPGDYYVFAKRRDELPPIVTPDFVQANLEGTQRVTLVAGETKQIEIRTP